MLCVMNSTVLLRLDQMRCSSRFIFSRVIASSAPNGSSISSTAGSCTSARQIDARCCMPPDSCHGNLRSKSLQARHREQRARRVDVLRARQLAHLDLQQHVVEHACATRAAPGSGTRCRRCRAARRRGLPPSAMLPVDAGSRPATIFSSVDLPQPDGPTIAMNSPSRMSNVERLQRLDRTVGGVVGLGDAVDADQRRAGRRREWRCGRHANARRQSCASRRGVLRQVVVGVVVLGLAGASPCRGRRTRTSSVSVSLHVLGADAERPVVRIVGTLVQRGGLLSCRRARCP